MYLVAAIQLFVMLGAFGAARLKSATSRKILSCLCGFWALQSALTSFIMPAIGLCLFMLFVAVGFGFACRAYWPRRARAIA
jgi:hypothetical protein